MLFFLLRLDDDRYALDAGRIVEILPLVTVKRIPQAAAGIAGIIDYHGTPVPLVDLNQLALGRPARRRLDTRIVIVDYPDRDGTARWLGVRRVFCLTFEVDFFAKHGFVEIGETPVDTDVYAELLRSYDEGVAEFLGLERVKPNTLGNSRMLLHL